MKEDDWRVLACKTSTSSETIWLNKTGTFGVASAAYWWSRLMGLVGRFALNVMLDVWFFALIFVHDIHMASGCSSRLLSLWRFITLLEMAGLPFSFHKFRGGFQMDFVRFWVDYTRFKIGMSERRVAWLVNFVEELISNEWLLHIRQFQEFQGRWGFAAQVLYPGSDRCWHRATLGYRQLDAEQLSRCHNWLQRLVSSFETNLVWVTGSCLVVSRKPFWASF